MKNYSNNLIKIQRCPICNSSRKIFLNYPFNNLYSEKISRILGIEENYLLNKIRNVKCLKCHTVYKNYWFNPKILKKLFKRELSLHPKGMDIYKKRFSKKFFQNEYQKLINLGDNKLSEINKSRRTLISIIDSINYKKKTFFNLKKKLNDDNKYKYIEKEIMRVSNLIKKPKRFSRFTGYHDEKLWNFIQRKISFKNYYEVGCPSWGLLRMAKKFRKNIFFFLRNENNFWNEKLGCLRYSKLRSKEIVSNFKKDQDSLFGIIEYIDHLYKPFNFLQKISYFHNNFFVISDNPKKNNIAIQHFTGFNKKTFSFIAKQLNMKVLIYDNVITNKNMIIAFFKKKENV